MLQWITYITRAQNVQEKHQIPLQSTNDIKGQAHIGQISHFNSLMPILLYTNHKSTKEAVSEAAHYNKWAVDSNAVSKQIKSRNNFWN